MPQIAVHPYLPKTVHCYLPTTKLKIKNEKIEQSQLKTYIKCQPKAFITEEEIKAIQAKEKLTLKEAAILLNITPLTLRRWTLSGKITARKIGKKWTFKSTLIENFSK